VTPRAFDDTVYRLGGDGREVALAEGPFFAHEAARFVPIGLFQGEAHFLRDIGDSLEAILYGALATDLRFENFPIVDAVLPWFSGVADQDAAFELVQVDAQLDAVFTAGREFDGRCPAEC